MLKHVPLTIATRTSDAYTWGNRRSVEVYPILTAKCGTLTTLISEAFYSAVFHDNISAVMFAAGICLERLTRVYIVWSVTGGMEAPPTR